jgi:tetratricopeptide (TPR) repeat protein
MKKSLPLLFIIALLSVAAAAQRIEKPTLTPKPCTDAQQALINEGIELHDAKKYEEAAAKYQTVLTENPDCTVALYELSMTQYTMGDKTKAMETAYKGSKYRSEQLPLFYLTMANIIDDVGKPDEAVKIYLDAIKMLEGDKTMLTHLASLRYNLAVTYVRQKKLNESRAELKRAIEANPQYASPHYMLAEVFLSSRYKIPAFLAAARFISLEYATPRTQRAAAIINQIAGSSTQKNAKGGITINLDLAAPTDEGDFGVAELLLAITDSEIDTKDSKKIKLSPQEAFAERIDSFIGMLDDKEKKNSKTFVGINYFPFMREMKTRGYVKPFAYLVLTSAGDPDALKWIGENDAKMFEFVGWAKNYRMQ